MTVTPTDIFIAYFAGFSILWCMHGIGKVRRIIDRAYRPLVWLGLGHGWSMYAPEVPKATRVIQGGVVLDDGSFVLVDLPGFDGDGVFGRAHNLRFITFQFKLNSGNSDYLKPALCDAILDRWREAAVPEEGASMPIAVELREYAYTSPEPGDRRNRVDPVVDTVWRIELPPTP